MTFRQEYRCPWCASTAHEYLHPRSGIFEIPEKWCVGDEQAHDPQLMIRLPLQSVTISRTSAGASETRATVVQRLGV